MSNENTAPVGELSEIAKELRCYHPPSDRYNGVYIHKGWADRIDAIIAADRALRASPVVGDVAAVPTFAQITAIRQAVDTEYEPILAKLQREHDSAMNERNHARHDQEDAQAALDANDAEIDRLRTLSVENIMLSVVPGWDGMGEEVYAKSVKEVEETLSQMGECIENYELGITIKPMDKGLATKDAEIAALTAERDAAMFASRYQTDMCGQAITDLKKMTAELDSLRKDAERYHWIQDRTRGVYGTKSDQEFVLPHVARTLGQDLMRGSVARHLDDALDKAIAAMTKEPK